MDRTATESDYSAAQALLAAFGLLGLVGLTVTVIVANLGVVLQ